MSWNNRIENGRPWSPVLFSLGETSTNGRLQPKELVQPHIQDSQVRNSSKTAPNNGCLNLFDNRLLLRRNRVAPKPIRAYNGVPLAGGFCHFLVAGF